MSRFSREFSRVNPLHHLQSHAFKQVFATPRYKNNDQLSLQRHVLDGMFFRINSLVLALHRQHLPILFWVRRDGSRLQDMVFNYGVFLSNSNTSLMVVDHRPGMPSFAKNQMEGHGKAVDKLWANLDPAAFKGGEALPVRTKWWMAFVRILFTIYRNNLATTSKQDLVVDSPINSSELQKMVDVFLRLHNYHLAPKSNPGAVFYIGRPYDKNVDPVFQEEIMQLGVPLITVGHNIDSYKFPGTPDNIYLSLFYMYYLDKLTKKYQADEYHPTPPRWSNTQPYPMTL